MGGVAKGGHPVDVTAESTVDLTSSRSEFGCGSDLIGGGLEAAAVAQFKDRGDQDFPSSITEVMRPMEMAELVDILPTLSLIEEETPSGPSTPSVMHMLQSFGLGIGENSSFFDLENSDLISEAGCLSEPELLCASEALCERTTFQGQDTSASGATESSRGDGETASSCNRDTQQVAGKGASLPLRSQVEWDRSSNGSS